MPNGPFFSDPAANLFRQVSVFDSSVQGGDAVWEGVRVYKGRVFCLDRCVECARSPTFAFSS